jgi:hypothetical protein
MEDAAQPYATFTERSSNAATVTINRSTTGRVATVIDRDQWLYSTDDIHELDEAGGSFSFGASDDFTVMAVLRYEDFTLDGSVVDKRAGYGASSAGWHLHETGSAGDLVFEIADGASEESVNTTGGPMSARVLTSNTARRTAGSEIAVFVDGANKATDTDTGLDLTGDPDTMRLGQIAGDFLEGQIMALAIWLRALTDAEVLEAHDLLIRQVQYLRPDSDIAVGGWTPTPSSPTTLFDKLDEVLPVDADFITEA